MGRLLESRLIEKGHEITAVVEPFCKSKQLPSGAAVYATLRDALAGIEGKGLKDADAVIEFTTPDAAYENILFLAGEKIPLITGTTGWYDRMSEVEKAVAASGSSLLWSPNFSLGVNIFYRIAANAAKLIDPFEDYDVGGFEAHHNKKADSPSGTAKILVERVLSQMTRKKKAVYRMPERSLAGDELHFASLRLGSQPGIHSLAFDSAADTIEITHTARSREGLASGAVLAAEWLVRKKQAGIFTFDDVLADILP